MEDAVFKRPVRKGNVRKRERPEEAEPDDAAAPSDKEATRCVLLSFFSPSLSTAPFFLPVIHNG